MKDVVDGAHRLNVGDGLEGVERVGRRKGEVSRFWPVEMVREMLDIYAELGVCGLVIRNRFEEWISFVRR